MKKVFLGFLFSLLIFVLPKFGFAADQVSVPVKMDGTLWSNGKIYVVVMVIFTIFLGIILTLLYLEKKIKKLEKNNA